MGKLLRLLFIALSAAGISLMVEVKYDVNNFEPSSFFNSANGGIRQSRSWMVKINLGRLGEKISIGDIQFGDIRLTFGGSGEEDKPEEMKEAKIENLMYTPHVSKPNLCPPERPEPIPEPLAQLIGNKGAKGKECGAMTEFGG